MVGISADLRTTADQLIRRRKDILIKCKVRNVSLIINCGGRCGGERLIVVVVVDVAMYVSTCFVSFLETTFPGLI